MSPGKVGGKGHHEYRPIDRVEIDRTAALIGPPPGPKPENTFFAERDCDYRSAMDQIDGAVAVPTDVMPQLSVIPIQQNAIETLINSLVKPLKQWHQRLRDRKRLVDLASIAIVHPIGLLPSGDMHEPSVDFDLVKLRWVHRPKRLKASRVRREWPRQHSNQE